MADNRGQPKLRGRGRAKDAGAAAGARRPGEQGGPSAPAASAWGAPQRPTGPAQPPPPQAPATRPTAPAPHSQAAGRGVALPRGSGESHDLQQKLRDMTLESGAGASAGGGEGGRGAHRGMGRMIQPRESRFVTRPTDVTSKKGTSGQPLDILANYFELKTVPDWALYQYHVDFEPEEDRTPVRKGLLSVHRNVLGGYLFDGTSLYCTKRLNPDPMELYSERKEDSQKMRIIVKLTNDVAAGDYQYFQVFNIIHRRALNSLDLKLINRDFYDSKCMVEIPEYKLQILPGYRTTINQHENARLLVVEIAHKVLRRDTVLDMMRQYFESKQGNFKKAFQEDIVGSIVITDFNMRTYRVDDVDWSATPETKFKMRGDEEISFVDYYKKKNITITDRRQPLLISRAKASDIRRGLSEQVLLVPELCRLTGLTDAMRADFKLMKALAQHTKVGPDMRIKKLMDFNRRLQTQPEAREVFKQWNMALADKLVSVKGRQLPQENIVQGASVRYPAGDSDMGWTNELRSRPMLSIGEVNSWAVIAPERLERDVMSFAKMVADCGRKMGFMLNKPIFEFMRDDRSSSYAQKLEELISRHNPTTIMCCLMKNNPDRYEAIKKKTCIDRPLPTQVVVAKSMTNKNAMSIATKVAIQMNAKVGGAPWSVDIPMSGIMIVGYDVCHDTKSKEKSFGALVASLDRSCTQYYSTVDSHSKGEELSSHLGMNLALAVKEYKAKNGTFPTHIVIYRDGVGDGQIKDVAQHELEIVKAKLTELYSGNNFKLGFIIVSKRINARIFLANSRNNPRPGTIIDDVITLPERYDFFLVSQTVREGTVSPTSYNVIYNTLGLTPDKIQRLTYKLTHIYFNCSNPVRVPAPCQYAHKLAFLAAQSLHTRPHHSLNTSLYFL